MTRRTCYYSGTITDDAYRSYYYFEGIPVVTCPDCGARRKLQIVQRTLGRRSGYGEVEDMLMYPYHKPIKRKGGEL